jgi:hypothetical protein
MRAPIAIMKRSKMSVQSTPKIDSGNQKLVGHTHASRSRANGLLGNLFEEKRCDLASQKHNLSPLLHVDLMKLLERAIRQ